MGTFWIFVSVVIDDGSVGTTTDALTDIDAEGAGAFSLVLRSSTGL